MKMRHDNLVYDKSHLSLEIYFYCDSKPTQYPKLAILPLVPALKHLFISPVHWDVNYSAVVVFFNHSLN